MTFGTIWDRFVKSRKFDFLAILASPWAGPGLGFTVQIGGPDTQVRSKVTMEAVWWQLRAEIVVLARFYDVWDHLVPFGVDL